MSLTEFIIVYVYFVLSFLIALKYVKLWKVHDYPKYLVKYNHKVLLWFLRNLAFLFAFLLPYFALFDILEYTGKLDRYKNKHKGKNKAKKQKREKY